MLHQMTKFQTGPNSEYKQRVIKKDNQGSPKPKIIHFLPPLKPWVSTI